MRFEAPHKIKVFVNEPQKHGATVREEVIAMKKRKGVCGFFEKLLAMTDHAIY